MLIRIFRSTGLFPPVLLAILTGLMWVISLSGSYSIIPPNGMPFYDAVCGLMGKVPAWTGALLGWLLHFSQAIHLNLVLNKHDVHFKKSWLPALIYAMLAGLIPPFLSLHPALFATTFLIFALDMMFGFYKNREALSILFHTGFLLGLASLFYLPTVVLFVFFFLSLTILRPFSWREWVVGLYRESDGTLCPILLWADPQIDLFWDPSLRRHVKPPSAYLLLPNQPHLGSSTPSDVARPRQ